MSKSWSVSCSCVTVRLRYSSMSKCIEKMLRKRIVTISKVINIAITVLGAEALRHYIEVVTISKVTIATFDCIISIFL
jgi:hypothetical protein